MPHALDWNGSFLVQFLAWNRTPPSPGIRWSRSTIRIRSTVGCATKPRSTTTTSRTCGSCTRFDDVQAAAKDWETFSSTVGGRGNDVDDTFELFLPAGDLAGVDPPVHTRLRGALRLAFSPSALRTRFEPIVRRKAVQLIEAFGEGGRADFARDLARPLPATTMFSWFGFPESDHPQLLGWFGEMLERDPGEPALPDRALAGRDRMRAYMQAAAADRRRSPNEDLMSFLVEAVEAGQISADELTGGAMLLFVAGITTTSGLISNSLLHLDRFPDQRDRIRDDPSILPAAIEELPPV